MEKAERFRGVARLTGTVGVLSIGCGWFAFAAPGALAWAGAQHAAHRSVSIRAAADGRQIGQYGRVMLDPYGMTPLRFTLSNHSPRPATLVFRGVRELHQEAKERLDVTNVTPRRVRLLPGQQRRIEMAIHCSYQVVRWRRAGFQFQVDNGKAGTATYTLFYRANPGAE